MRIDKEGRDLITDLLTGHEMHCTGGDLCDELRANLARFEVVDENVPPIGRELCNEMLQFWADHKPRLFIPGECEPEEGQEILISAPYDRRFNPRTAVEGFLENIRMHAEEGHLFYWLAAPEVPE